LISYLRGNFRVLVFSITQLGRAPGAAALPDLVILICRDWAELDLPPLARLVAGLGDILAMLDDTGANQFRSFAFTGDGAIRFCTVFLKLDEDLARFDADTLMLAQTVQSLLLWSDTAFLTESPVARSDTGAIVRPDLAALVRAAYAPDMPDASSDPALVAGPPVAPPDELVAWLEAHATGDEPKLVRLPVAIPADAGDERLTGERPYRLRGSLVYLTPGELADVLFDARLYRPTVSFADGGVIDFGGP